MYEITSDVGTVPTFWLHCCRIAYSKNNSEVSVRNEKPLSTDYANNSLTVAGVAEGQRKELARHCRSSMHRLRRIIAPQNLGGGIFFTIFVGGFFFFSKNSTYSCLERGRRGRKIDHLGALEIVNN